MPIEGGCYNTTYTIVITTMLRTFGIVSVTYDCHYVIAVSTYVTDFRFM